jgi:hypothetical protein
VRYIIFVPESARPLTKDVDPLSVEYLTARVIPQLRTLTESDYRNGPKSILSTAARWSYILHDQNVLWCVEWEPGLLVVEFSPSGQMRWSALDSPVPNFGGRLASEDELAAFDEDEPNPQYNIVFDAWDAEVDSTQRTGWTAATDTELHIWNEAMRRPLLLSSDQR